MLPEENAVTEMTEQTHEDETGHMEDAPVEASFTSVSRNSCSRCGVENDSHLFTCRGCRRLLVAAPGDDMTVDDGDRLFVLVQACEMVEAGEATLADFRIFIRDFVVEQQRRESSIRTTEIPFGLEDEFAEEKAVGYQGVDMVNAALESLAAYDPTSEHAHETLTEGVRMFHEGMVKVRDAMRINRSNVSRPLWI